MPTPTINRLPHPSRVHATCAWCRANFATIIDLIDHVDRGHTAIASPAMGTRSIRRTVDR